MQCRRGASGRSRSGLSGAPVPVCGTRGDCGESTDGAAGWPGGVFAEEALKKRWRDVTTHVVMTKQVLMERLCALGAAATSSPADVSRSVCTSGGDPVAGGSEGGGAGGHDDGRRARGRCRTNRRGGPICGVRRWAAAWWGSPADRTRRVGSPLAVGVRAKCSAQTANRSAPPLHVGGAAAAGVPDPG